MLKKALLSGLHRSGVNSFLTRRHKRDLLVLGYHGIVSEPKNPPFRYHHTLREFQTQLEWLGKSFTVIGIGDLPRWLKGDLKARKPPALITFDDGYRNNVTHAAPALRRAGMPAIFFLATGYVGERRILWTDEIFLRIEAWPKEPLRDPLGAPVPLSDDLPERRSVAARMTEASKKCSDQKRQAYLEHLRRRTPDLEIEIDPEAQDFMSWEEARQLVSAGFELGSHTRSHPILSRISSAAARDELRQSREAVQAESGAPCTAIAYPNGRASDINDQVVAAAKETGYRYGFVVSDKWHTRPAEFLIDRIIPPVRADIPAFAFYVSGAREWLRRS